MNYKTLKFSMYALLGFFAISACTDLEPEPSETPSCGKAPVAYLSPAIRVKRSPLHTKI